MLSAVSNMVPTLTGYGGIPSAINGGLPALGENATTLIAINKLDGSRRTFAAAATAIYEDIGTAWADRSEPGGYDVGTDRWSFAQFGDNTLAASKFAVLQKSKTGSFASIAGAPKAALVAIANGFAMLADTNEDLYGDQPNRWWCSGLHDPTTWIPSAITQSTTGLLVDVPGPIKALVSLGDGFAAYKQGGIFVGTYVGYPSVWQWQLIPGGIGCVTPHGVISTGRTHLFIGLDNIYQFDGVQPMPIGDKIKRWFFSQLNLIYMTKIIGYYDPFTGLAWWHYCDSTVTDGVTNKCLIYNTNNGRFGLCDIVAQAAQMVFVPGITYYGIGGIYNTYNDIPDWLQYNSATLVPNIAVPTYIDTSQILQRNTGAHRNCSLTTGNYGDGTSFVQLRDIRPSFITTPTTSTLLHKYNNDLGVTFSDGDTASLFESKWDVLNSSKWHRFKLSFTGDVEIVDIDMQASKRGAI